MDVGNDGEAGGPREGSDAGSDAGAFLERGQSLGRYLVIGVIGKGGMGEVYAAYDPELDRKIAVKLLRVRPGEGSEVSEGRARLLREAQAIARLSHPNVVAVYDVGTYRERIFLAMEFVEGSTISQWISAEPRSWREIVTLFLGAGQGLASAHRVGVIHRDFKPDNVMITRDDRARVMDFGLARAIDRPHDAEVPFAMAGRPDQRLAPGLDAGSRLAKDENAPLPLPLPRPGAGAEAADRGGDPSSTAPSPSASLTITGAMMGTPAYMAPEQFRGTTTDARTDQFSFCVALYEALYQERPFPGSTLAALTGNVMAGVMRPALSSAGVPGWLRRLLLRGLSVDPADRYASMEDLLAALGRDPGRRRTLWALGAFVLTLLITLAGGLIHMQRQLGTRCVGGDARLQGVWEVPVAGRTSARRGMIERAFEATGKDYAAHSFVLVAQGLDDYVKRWSSMVRESCEATNLRGDQSAEVLDLRTACLGDRLSEVRALTDLFVHADGDVVTNSLQAVEAIRPIEPCADASSLRAVVRPPEDPELRRAVATVRTELAGIKALATAGQYRQAGKEISEVTDRAGRTGYQPVLAEALLQLAELQTQIDEPTKAAKTYEEALLVAEASRHDEVVLQAATELVYVVGYSQGRYADSERWGRLADAVLERVGPGHDLIAGWLANNRGATYEQQGRLEDALAAHLEAVRLKLAALGPRQPDTAGSESNVALALLGLGRLDEAQTRNDQALGVMTETLGLQHPRAAQVLVNGAEILTARGRYLEARNMARQALEIFERDLDPGHPWLAYPLIAIGMSYLEGEQSPLAVPFLERALRLREQGEVQPDMLGEVRFALGRALWESGLDLSRGLALARQAEEDYRRSAHRKEKAQVIRQWIEERAQRPNRGKSVAPSVVDTPRRW